MTITNVERELRRLRTLCLQNGHDTNYFIMSEALFKLLVKEATKYQPERANIISDAFDEGHKVTFEGFNIIVDESLPDDFITLIPKKVENDPR